MNKGWLLVFVSGVAYSNAPGEAAVRPDWSPLWELACCFNAVYCLDNVCGFVKSFTEIGLDKKSQPIAEYHNSPWRFRLNWLLPENLGGKDVGAQHKVATQGFNTMYNALWVWNSCQSELCFGKI